MQEITIKNKGAVAKIWIQDISVGGIVTDEENNETVVATTYFNEDAIERYFASYKEITGKDFFTKKHNLKSA